MRKKFRNKIIRSYASALALSMMAVLCGCSGSKNYDYKYEKVTVGEIKKTISVTGVLEVINENRVLSKVTGIVNEVNADFNASVSRGQVLAVIDSSDIDQELIRFRDNLESKKYEKMQAEKDLEGKQQLYRENLLPKQTLELAQSKYQSTTISLKHYTMNYEDKLQQKRDAIIRAPVSGIILSREIELKQRVKREAPLFVIAPSLKTMRLIISIDESDIGNIKEGQMVTFRVSAFYDKEFSGKITQVRINPIKTGGLVTYQAVVVCDNTDLSLKPGMTATAVVEVARKSNVLRISNQAFIVNPYNESDDSERNYMWKKNLDPAGELHVKEQVETGVVGDMFTELKSVIKPGSKYLVKVIEKAEK